jgi:hypothetical protein
MLIFPPLSFLGVLILGSNIYAMRNLFLEGLAIQLASQYSKFVELEEEIGLEIERLAEEQIDRRYGDNIDRYHNSHSDGIDRHHYDIQNRHGHSPLGAVPENQPTPIKISIERSPRNYHVHDWIDNHQLGVSLDSTFERDQRPGPSRVVDDIPRRSSDSPRGHHSSDHLHSDFLLPPPRISRHSSFQDESRRHKTMTITRSSR